MVILKFSQLTARRKTWKMYWNIKTYKIPVFMGIDYTL